MTFVPATLRHAVRRWRHRPGLATIVPAWRATRINPAVTLREE